MKPIVDAQKNYLNALLDRYEAALSGSAEEYCQTLRAIAAFAKSSADVVEELGGSSSTPEQPSVRRFAEVPVATAPNMPPKTPLTYQWPTGENTGNGADPKSARSRSFQEERQVTLPAQGDFPFLANGYYYPQ